MATITQAIKLYIKKKKKPFCRTYKLRRKPQILVVTKRLFFHSPKKPNSGKRRVAKCIITHLHREDRLTARLVGYLHFPKKFWRLLIRGGRANDTPGVTYSAIRGAADFAAHIGKKWRRSFYGVKREKDSITHIRRCERKSEILAKLRKK